MKYQILISEKINKTIANLSLAELVQRMVRFKWLEPDDQFLSEIFADS